MDYTSIRDKLIRLTARIIIWTILSFLLIASGMGVYTIYRAFNKVRLQIRENLVSKGTVLVTNNSTALSELVADNAFSSIRELISTTINEDPDVVYGIFMDGNRRSWYSISPDHPDGGPAGVNILDDSVSVWAAGVKKTEKKTIRTSSGPVIEFAAPVTNDGERLGTIRYGVSTQAMDRTITATRNGWLVSIISFVIAFTAVAALVFVLAFRAVKKQAAAITGPLRDLARAADHIAEGNYDASVSLATGDEVEKLAQSFDTMRSTVKDYTENLEKKVEERTEELNKTLAELEGMNEKLYKSNQELTDFAHVASHDLQEPLRKVVSFGDRIKSRAGDRLDERSLDYLTRMQDAADRMGGLLQGLLRYARVSTKAKPFETVDLDTVAREVLEDLEVRVQETGATVNLEALPAIEADALQMRQLLQNLIGNALKYKHPDVAPVVTVSGGNGRDSGIMELRVADNGIGIAEEDKDKVFGIFQRLHGRGEYEGSGVGLSICKKIVERHHGTIGLESEVGKGTTFITRLPVKQNQ